jgi:hypothetical protein
MNDPRTRQFLLYGVPAVGFLIPFVRSLSIFPDIWHPGPGTAYSFVFRISFESVGLLCLYFVLRDQKKRLADRSVRPTRTYKTRSCA